jgi:hypothetical protein
MVRGVSIMNSQTVTIKIEIKPFTEPEETKLLVDKDFKKLSKDSVEDAPTPDKTNENPCERKIRRIARVLKKLMMWL